MNLVQKEYLFLYRGSNIIRALVVNLRSLNRLKRRLILVFKMKYTKFIYKIIKYSIRKLINYLVY